MFVFPSTNQFWGNEKRILTVASGVFKPISFPFAIKEHVLSADVACRMALETLQDHCYFGHIALVNGRCKQLEVFYSAPSNFQWSCVMSLALSADMMLTQIYCKDQIILTGQSHCLRVRVCLLSGPKHPATWRSRRETSKRILAAFPATVLSYS